MKLIDLLDKPTPTVAELVKKYNTTPDLLQAQLTKGIKVELEHTSHEHVARQIALDHLGERLDYYTQLAKIDEQVINNEHGWGKVPNNQNVDYLGLRVNMKPSMFLKLAAPLERAHAVSVQDMVQHLKSGGTVASPWLVIHIPDAWEEGDYDQAARVVSHEGRNRMYAIQDVQGDAPVEVHVFLGAGMRARHIQPDWVTHMMHELIPQGQKTPQQGPWFTPISHNVAEHLVAEAAPVKLGPQLYVPHPKNLKEGLKPAAKLWTSTAKKTAQGYTSAWAEWCSYAMPQWLASQGTLYDVQPGAKILSINTDRQARAIAKKYGVQLTNIMSLLTLMPWDKISLDYDAVHHVPSGDRLSNMLMGTWDVESTAWFNTNYLTNPRKVHISTQEQPLDEAWSRKYKQSINCDNPKGFSQRAHCAGRKARSAHKQTKSAPVSEATTRTSKTGAPGTLKAKISGPVTCDKVKHLKNREKATPHDVRQANWFINMHACSESVQLTEIFQEPAQHVKWHQGQHGDYHFFETEFAFQGKRVKVGLYEDHDQTSARFVTRNTDIDLPSTYKGYSVVFSVNGETDVTGELGTSSAKLFAQVVSVLKGFLMNHVWDYVLFVGGEESRDRLYDALAHLLANQVGAKVATYRSDFLIYKPSPLQEVFDSELSSDNWKVVKKNPSYMRIEFVTASEPYEITIDERFKKHPGIFEVAFYHTDSDDDIGIIGTGNAFQVFSTVAQLLQYAIKELRIKAFYFTAEEPSRIKLYRTLCKYFSAKLNWKFTQDPQWMPTATRETQFLVYKLGFSLTEAGGVGLVVPGINMPAGIHPDEIRRQARKWGFKVSAHGVPPVARTDGKM